jgi:hypothetical protein
MRRRWQLSAEFILALSPARTYADFLEILSPAARIDPKVMTADEVSGAETGRRVEPEQSP